MIALAEATIDAAGQAAGLASKTAAVHAFCNVVNLDGNCLGRSTLTRAMFASSVCERVMAVAFLMVGKGNRGSSSYFLPFLVFLEVVACDGFEVRCSL